MLRRTSDGIVERIARVLQDRCPAFRQLAEKDRHTIVFEVIREMATINRKIEGQEEAVPEPEQRPPGRHAHPLAIKRESLQRAVLRLVQEALPEMRCVGINMGAFGADSGLEAIIVPKEPIDDETPMCGDDLMSDESAPRRIVSQGIMILVLVDPRTQREPAREP